MLPAQEPSSPAPRRRTSWRIPAAWAWLPAGAALALGVVAHGEHELSRMLGRPSAREIGEAGKVLAGRVLTLGASDAERASNGDLRVRLPEPWWGAVPRSRGADGQVGIFVDGRRLPLVVGKPADEIHARIAYYYAPLARSLWIRCGDAPCRELLVTHEDRVLRAAVLVHRSRLRPALSAVLAGAAIAALWLACACGSGWLAGRRRWAMGSVWLGLTTAFWACLLGGAYETAWSGGALVASCLVLAAPALGSVASAVWLAWSGAAARVVPHAVPTLAVSPSVVAGVAIVIFAGRVATLMYVQSPTLDEVIHIPAGYSYWNHQDFWLNPEHPPIAKLVSGLGFTLLHGAVSWRPTKDFTGPASMCRSFFLPDVMARTRCARLPMLAFSVLLLVALYCIVRHLVDATTAVLAVWAVAALPVFVAHSVFVHTDVPASLAFLAVFGAAAARPSGLFRWRALLLGAVAALGMLMKFSVAIAVLGILAAVPSWAPTGRRLRQAAGFSASLLVFFVVFSWGLYMGCSEPTRERLGASPARWLRASIPSHYVDGWTRVRGHNEQGHAHVFLRQDSQRGHLAYFPLAIAVKTPIPMLAAMVVGLAAILRWPPPWFPAWAAVAGLYTCFLLGSNINIGVRHALPLLILLAMPLAVGIRWFLEGARRRVAGAMLMTWLLATSFLHAGSELAYFNEVARGQGWRYLGDSNVDWGQSVAALGRFTRKHQVTPLYHDLSTAFPPSWFGVDGVALEDVPPGSDLRPGWYAVSAVRLASTEGGRLDYFRSARPAATFGGAIYLYHVGGRHAGRC